MIGRNMPNTSFQYSEVGASPFSSATISPGTADFSLLLCRGMESSSSGFRGGHGLATLGFNGQDPLGSCAPRSAALAHDSGPGGFSQQGKGASASYSSPHRFEAMKARSFVEEAQGTVTGIPISNPSFVNDMMTQNYQSLAPGLRKDCGPTVNGFMGMPFFPGGLNGCAMPNHGLTRISKGSTEMSSNGLSAGFPSSNRGAHSQVPHCNQNIFESAYAYSQQGKQIVGDNLQNPSECQLALPAQASNFVTEAPAFHGAAVCSGSPASSFGGGPLPVDASSCAKRLIRTDSHERLSSISSERVNAENLFYCKGRRWGGEYFFTQLQARGMPLHLLEHVTFDATIFSKQQAVT
jgi:hypothetical protein